ncbi:MAG: hypothetical protein LUJ09_04585 [Firmicutes bacterium]|nr:hypothetical protein [Bacillota bacterium]
MRRWIVYLLLFCAVLALNGEPFGGTDLAQLSPVKLLQISRQADTLRIETDTGYSGEGADLDAALQDLADTTPGMIFLETADYLLLSPDCQTLLPALADSLRPACAVCLTWDTPELEEAAEYLTVHEPDVTLHDCLTGQPELPVLVQQKGRLCLVQ